MSNDALRPRRGDCRARNRAGRERAFVAGSSSRIRFMYFEKSKTTATLQHCPARLVPPPRLSTGAPNCRHNAMAADRIVGVARDDDADWHLAIIRAVGRVQGAAAVVEPHFAAKILSQSLAASAAASTPASPITYE